MSQVLITGATGLVGSHLLRLLIQARNVNHIIAPTRHPLAEMPGVFNPHAPQLMDALAQVQNPVDIAFCCLGTTRRQAGSRAAFEYVDDTLVTETALAAKKRGAKHLLVVSAHGANADSPFFYNRVTSCRLSGMVLPSSRNNMRSRSANWSRRQPQLRL